MKTKGFTLLELLVIAGIIGLMSAVLVPAFRAGDQHLALERSLTKLAQDIRRAQDMALSAKEIAGAVPHGYGIYFEPATYDDRYFLFADFDGNEAWTSGETIETIELESSVSIYGLSPAAPMSVTFVPPNPEVIFSPVDLGSALIVLESDTLQMIGYQYDYNRGASVYGLLTPRASCDISDIIADCPISFPASAWEPEKVYDQKAAGTRSASSYIFQKTGTPITMPLRKTVSINGAGLIYAE